MPVIVMRMLVMRMLLPLVIKRNVSEVRAKRKIMMTLRILTLWRR